MQSENIEKPKTTENPVKYDYWTLKEKEFFKGTDKPDSKPKLVGTEATEAQK